MTQPIAEILNSLEQALQKATGEQLALYMGDCIVAEAEVEDENAAIIARFFDDEESANAKFFVLAKNHLPSVLAELRRLQDMARWRNPENELPDDGRDCIVMDRADRIVKAHFNDTQFIYTANDNDGAGNYECGMSVRECQLWMPLPAKPKETK